MTRRFPRLDRNGRGIVGPLRAPSPHPTVTPRRYLPSPSEAEILRLNPEAIFSSDDPNEAPRQPEIIIAPATQGPWGVVTETSGPEDPSGPPHPKLLGADALLRRGMVALDKFRPRRLDEAEVCFRQALDLLEEVLDEPHPRISYALDRIGLVCHLRDRLDEAEALYLRSLAVLGDGRSPTRWNDVTILNLAVLYGRQGRAEERDAVMRLYES